jgi:hypothetical protein
MKQNTESITISLATRADSRSRRTIPDSAANWPGDDTVLLIIVNLLTEPPVA